MKRIGIITGASSGMGAEFARQLAEDSSIEELWLLARRLDRLCEIEKEINTARSKKTEEGRGEKKSGPLARSFEVDLSGRTGVSAFKAILKAESLSDKEDGFEIAILVNNAGFGTYGVFEETSLDRELDMIDLNCTALTGITGLALPFMARGSILINTASLASFLPLGNFAVYGATKAYVLSFTTAIAAELADRGIKVCSLCPGPVSTEFASVASCGARKEVLHGKSAEKTVSHCLKKARAGRHIALMAFEWKFKAFMSRLIPRYAGARFTYKYCKRPCAKINCK